MGLYARKLFPSVFGVLLAIASSAAAHADARFDLVGPKIDVRVTRTAADGTTQTLPIAAVPNLQPGDRLWLHPDLPPSQSVRYLLICAFLRGTTNPPPDNWFIRIETWDRHVREEGVFVKVPDEAQQVVLFMAPETGGDFTTLKSAIKGRPGAFVRASQDLTEAGFEQARIEKYMASIRLVPPSDPADLQKHSDLLARTLALKPNDACFKQPVDTQFTCLTQSGSQMVLDDGHGQSIISALSNGPNSDLINQASYTSLAGAGLYSAYVGAIVDMVRILGNLHTAQYQYIPAIAFPQDASLNLRLNAPPSFHNPKSVLVIALPSVQKAQAPPLRPADATHVACLLAPTVVLPIEGAPLVFSTAFAHDLVLHLNTPPGAPAEADIPLKADAYQGGLVLQTGPQHHVVLRDPVPLTGESAPADLTHPDLPHPATPKPLATQPEPVRLTGTIQGRWGFDSFTGPTVELQQRPGTGWALAAAPSDDASPAPGGVIAGKAGDLLLTSTGSACVHTITAHPGGATTDLNLAFKPAPRPDQPNLLAVTLPGNHAAIPGDLHLEILQYGQPRANSVAARTFAEPAHVETAQLHAGDRSLLLIGARLDQVEHVRVGDLVFSPAPAEQQMPAPGTLRLALPDTTPHPPTHAGDHLVAHIDLRDGRDFTLPLIVSAPRPTMSLLSKSAQPGPASSITLSNPDDVPLSSLLTFTLKTPTSFPRNGQVEVETLDGTLRCVLTLAPAGGLLLQDPHTIVASLDPLRSFGPSAFGALHVRIVYPPKPGVESEPEPASPTDTTAKATHDQALQAAATDATEPPSSDWQPLVTLVRLPTLTQIQCTADATQPCTLSGQNLFLLDAVSTDPAFANPVSVPDGFTGSALSVPHPDASTMFLKLRDDPTPVDSAVLPVALPAPPPAHSHAVTHAALTHAAHNE
jgi:hypothetical protein